MVNKKAFFCCENLRKIYLSNNTMLDKDAIYPQDAVELIYDNE